jgi:hypothetical protein
VSRRSPATQHHDGGACRRSASAFTSTASGGSRHGAVVIAQQTAEAFATRDRPSGIGVVIGRRDDQAVVEALVIALAVIVLDELRDREAEVAFTERNELVEALS